jgi:hypothetical protein
MGVRVRVLNPDDSLPAASAVGDERVTVGSGACDLRLPGDDIAPEHVAFGSMMCLPFIEPRGGVCLLNGAALTSRTLMRPGDRVGIGRFELVVEPLDRDFSFGDPPEGEMRGGMKVLATGYEVGIPYSMLVELPPTSTSTSTSTPTSTPTSTSTSTPTPPVAIWWKLGGPTPPEIRPRLEQRLRAHEALRDPFILALLGSALEGERTGWWTRFVPGVSLRYLSELVRPRPRAIGAAALSSIARDLARAVAVLRASEALADMRLVPGCIFIGWDGRVTLAVNHDACQPSAPPVHTRWFAPEQIDTAGAGRFGHSEQGAGSPASSVFTIGLFLYSLITGTHPHAPAVPGLARPSQAIAIAGHAPIASLRGFAGIDDAAAKLVDACLGPAAGDRPTLSELEHLEGAAPDALAKVLAAVASAERERQSAWLAQQR